MMCSVSEGNNNPSCHNSWKILINGENVHLAMCWRWGAGVVTGLIISTAFFTEFIYSIKMWCRKCTKIAAFSTYYSSLSLISPHPGMPKFLLFIWLSQPHYLSLCSNLHITIIHDIQGHQWIPSNSKCFWEKCFHRVRCVLISAPPHHVLLPSNLQDNGGC